MTRDDVRIIFGNINDLALFSDQFVERLEEALGGVLEGGSGEDSVGALFLELVRRMHLIIPSIILIRTSRVFFLTDPSP